MTQRMRTGHCTIAVIALATAGVLFAGAIAAAQESPGGLFDWLKKGLEEVGKGLEKAGQEIKKAIEQPGQEPTDTLTPPVPDSVVLAEAAGPLYSAILRNGTPEGEESFTYHSEVVSIIQNRLEVWQRHHQRLLRNLAEADQILEESVQLWAGNSKLPASALSWQEEEITLLQDHLAFLAAGKLFESSVATLNQQLQELRHQEVEPRIANSLGQSELAVMLIEALTAHTEWAGAKLEQVLVPSLVRHTAELQPKSGAPAAIIAKLRTLQSREKMALTNVVETITQANRAMVDVSVGFEAIYALGELAQKRAVAGLERELSLARPALEKLRQQAEKKNEADLVAQTVRSYETLIGLLKEEERGSWLKRWRLVSVAQAQQSGSGWGIVNGFKNVVSSTVSGAVWAGGKALTAGEWAAQKTAGAVVQTVDVVTKTVADEVNSSRFSPFSVYTPGSELAGVKTPQLAQSHDLQNRIAKAHQVKETFGETAKALRDGQWGVAAGQRAQEKFFSPIEDTLKSATEGVVEKHLGKGWTSWGVGLIADTVLGSVTGLSKAATQMAAATPGDHAAWVEPMATIFTSAIGGTASLARSAKVYAQSAARAERYAASAARQEMDASLGFIKKSWNNAARIDKAAADRAAGLISRAEQRGIVANATNNIQQSRVTLEKALAAAAEKRDAVVPKWLFKPEYKNFADKVIPFKQLLGGLTNKSLLFGAADGQIGNLVKNVVKKTTAVASAKPKEPDKPAAKAKPADKTEQTKVASASGTKTRREEKKEKEKQLDRRADALQKKIDEGEKARAEGKPEPSELAKFTPQEPGWPCPDRKECVIVIRDRDRFPKTEVIEPMTLVVRNGKDVTGKQVVKFTGDIFHRADGGGQETYPFTFAIQLEGELTQGRITGKLLQTVSSTWRDWGHEGSVNSKTCPPREYVRRGQHVTRARMRVTITLNTDRTAITEIQNEEDDIATKILEDTSCTKAKDSQFKHARASEKLVTGAGSYTVKALQ